MSYDLIEKSVQQGSPIELYTFVIGDTTYRFTTSADVITFDGDEYEAVTVYRDNIMVGSEERAEAITIVMPSIHAFPQSYATRVPGQRAMLSIRRLHREDGAEEAIFLFRGVVRSVAFTDKSGIARIAVTPAAGALARAIPRYTYQSLCNNVLFDSWCTKAQADFKYTGNASAISSATLTIDGLNAAKGADWSTAGFAIYGGDYRLILAQSGDTIKLLLPFNVSPVGDDVDVYAGCDHTLNTCKAKFDNAINYNGFPFVPIRNVFAKGLK